MQPQKPSTCSVYQQGCASAVSASRTFQCKEVWSRSSSCLSVFILPMYKKKKSCLPPSYFFPVHIANSINSGVVKTLVWVGFLISVGNKVRKISLCCTNIKDQQPWQKWLHKKGVWCSSCCNCSCSNSNMNLSLLQVFCSQASGDRSNLFSCGLCSQIQVSAWEQSFIHLVTLHLWADCNLLFSYCNFHSLFRHFTITFPKKLSH